VCLRRREARGSACRHRGCLFGGERARSSLDDGRLGQCDEEMQAAERVRLAEARRDTYSVTYACSGGGTCFEPRATSAGYAESSARHRPVRTCPRSTRRSPATIAMINARTGRMGGTLDLATAGCDRPEHAAARAPLAHHDPLGEARLLAGPARRREEDRAARRSRWPTPRSAARELRRSAGRGAARPGRPRPPAPARRGEAPISPARSTWRGAGIAPVAARSNWGSPPGSPRVGGRGGGWRGAQARGGGCDHLARRLPGDADDLMAGRDLRPGVPPQPIASRSDPAPRSRRHPLHGVRDRPREGRGRTG